MAACECAVRLGVSAKTDVSVFPVTASDDVYRAAVMVVVIWVIPAAVVMVVVPWVMPSPVAAIVSSPISSIVPWIIIASVIPWVIKATPVSGVSPWVIISVVAPWAI